MMKIKCNICNRKINGTIHIAFIPLKQTLYCPYVYGKNLCLCLECELSYLAQYFNEEMDELDDYIKWSSAEWK